MQHDRHNHWAIAASVEDVDYETHSELAYSWSMLYISVPRNVDWQE